MAYSDCHRAFLQALMARPYVDAEEAKSIIALIRSKEKLQNEQEGVVEAKDISNQEMNDFFTKVSEELSPFELSIRDSVDQRKGKRVWALVNNLDDDIIRLATTHSADEIAFFKRILDAIFDTYNAPQAEVLAIKSMQALALNKNSQPDRHGQDVDADVQDGEGEDGAKQQPATQTIGIGPGLTKKEAEEALKKFEDEGWLNRSKGGYYYLSTRALMELELYLIQTYNSAEGGGETILRIKQCNACKEIHTMGKRCDNLECDFRIHDHCVETFFRSRAKECPKCGTTFTGERPVGFKAGKDMPAMPTISKRRSSGVPGNSASGRSQRRRISRDADVMDGEEGEEDAGEDSSPLSTTVASMDEVQDDTQRIGRSGSENLPSASQEGEESE